MLHILPSTWFGSSRAGPRRMDRAKFGRYTRTRGYHDGRPATRTECSHVHPPCRSATTIEARQSSPVHVTRHWAPISWGRLAVALWLNSGAYASPFGPSRDDPGLLRESHDRFGDRCPRATQDLYRSIVNRAAAPRRQDLVSARPPRGAHKRSLLHREVVSVVVGRVTWYLRKATCGPTGSRVRRAPPLEQRAIGRSSKTLLVLRRRCRRRPEERGRSARASKRMLRIALRRHLSREASIEVPLRSPTALRTRSFDGPRSP